MHSSRDESETHVTDLKMCAKALDNSIKLLKLEERFEITDCNLPKNWANKIITLVERNENAAFIKFPKGMLTAQESQRLDVILKPRQEKAKQIQQEQKDLNQMREKNAQYKSKKGNNAFVNFSLAGIGLGLGLSIAFAPALLSLTSLYIISTAIFSGVIAGFCKEQYLNWSANQYQAKDIDTLKNEGEKEAIALGIESKSWSGYLNSFTNFQAYKHPVAFACGLQKAQAEETNFTDKFKVKP